MPVAYSERRDGVAGIGAAAVDPVRAACIPVYPARLPRPGLAGGRIQVSFMHGHPEDEHGIAGPTAVCPLGIRTPLIDPEMNGSEVGLRIGDARTRQNAQVDPRARCRVVFAQQIAEIVVQDLFRVHPKREREIAGSETGRERFRQRQPGAPAVKPGCGRPIRGGCAKLHSMFLKMTLMSGEVPAVRKERPVGSRFRSQRVTAPRAKRDRQRHKTRPDRH